MNRNDHKLMFNARRGQTMAMVHCPVTLSMLLILAFGIVVVSSARAQIVADPRAPSNQRPTVLQAPNGVPLVNIQTPSAAGVSRNTYSQFDVQSHGAILNNSRTNAPTQLGGWVQGNPWLATGSARVILNEVNSSNPSQLRGFVEVVGQRAEVIVANPAGILVNGAGFINASGVTLTTGTPVMNSGYLDAFRVQGGLVKIEGLGLDTRTADHTTILARAMQVNAALWAKDLTVVTGTNEVKALASGEAAEATQIASSGAEPKPAFMLDTGAVGGMYAGKIFLVGTEAGVGVNNQGVISADAGHLVLDSNGWLRNKGTVQASGNVGVHVKGEVTNAKDLYAGGSLSVTTSQALINSGNLNAQGSVQILAGAMDNLAGARMASNAQVQMHTSGAQTNQGEIVSAGDVILQAAALQNQGRLLSSAGNLTITSQGDVSNTGPNAEMYAAGAQHIDAAGSLTNSGLIAANGNLTVDANSVNSTGALAAGLNTDGSLKTVAARLDVRAVKTLRAQGRNLASGDLHLEGQALVMSGSQTRSGTLKLNATGLAKDVDSSAGVIDVSHADVLAHEGIDINGRTLSTMGSQLQAEGDIQIFADAIHNQAGLIRTNGHLSVTANDVDNRDTRSVNGANPLGFMAQSMNLTASELRNQGGAIIAGNDLNIVSHARIENAQGLISSGGTLDIRDTTTPAPTLGGSPLARNLSITNTGGTLIADRQLVVKARSLSLDGDLLSQQDMTLSVQGDHTHAQGSRIVANRDLTLDIKDGGLHNSGELLAGHNLNFTAKALDNTATGQIGAGNTTDVHVTGTLTNRGLIDGQTTRISAPSLNNLGTGRIYGGTLAVQADSLRNDTETVNGVRTDAVIAARQRLDIGARDILNRDGALIFSGGDLAIGGALDANDRADGSSSGMGQSLHNASATIEASGQLSVGSAEVRNTNEHIEWALSTNPATQHTEYFTSSGVLDAATQVGWLAGKSRRLSFLNVTLRGRDEIVPINSAYGDPSFRPYYLGEMPFVEGHYEKQGFGKERYDVWVDDAFNYTRDSAVWARFGMTAPAWDAPGQMPRAADSGDGTSPPDTQALAAWQTQAAPWIELNARIQAMKATVEAQMLPFDTYRSFTQSTQNAQVTASQPARLLSGGGMTVAASSQLLNQDSHILAGGALVLKGRDVTNQATVVFAPTQRSGTLSSWGVIGQDCDLFGCDPIFGWISSGYQETITRNVTLNAARVQSGTAPVGSGVAVPNMAHARTREAAAAANASSGAAGGTSVVAGMALPTSGLFKARPESTSSYLVETDPRFANYCQWLSSDYMLQALSIDPATTQKRLGDGYYEQKLVREQMASLTGQRYLGDYTSDEAQYQALMSSGATFAQAHQLRPGIALSAAQVAQLTSDIVWLVSENVALPDGSTTQALVPRVYAMPREGDLSETGALMAGKSVQINLSGDLTNTGNVGGRQLTQITAQNVNNLGGLIGGGTSTQVIARQDINNIGGSLSALQEMRLNAAGDITVQSTTSQGKGRTAQGVYSSQGVDRVAGLYVSKEAGVLIASAGGDVNLSAAHIQSAGSVQLQAGRDVNLGTVSSTTSMDATRDARNYTRIERSSEVGTQVQAAGAIELKAGRDLNARAATVQAADKLAVEAGRNLAISAGEDSLSVNTASYAKGRGVLSSGSTEIRAQRSQTEALASNFGGQEMNIRSGQDTTVRGSNVIGDKGLHVQAAGAVTIVAAQTQSASSHFREDQGSGLSFSGSAISYGSQKQSTQQDMRGTGAAASTAGAISGDVSITAGKTYTQTGSDVMAPGGDIVMAAQSVQITEARETSRTVIEQKFEQSGLSVSVGGGVIATAQGVVNTAKAVGETRNARMQALGAATLALQGQDLVAQGKNLGDLANAQSLGDMSKATGVSLSVSLGSSKSQSTQSSQSDTARGSTVVAGGDISISAIGAGDQSDINVRGSQLKAGGTTALKAEGDVSLLAAKNTYNESSSQSSSSGSIGVSIGVGSSGVGVSVNASASKGRGQGAGDETSYTNTQVGGQTVQLESGADTTLKGAVVSGEKVTAKVGKDLRIESLQDTATYDESSKSRGFSVSVPVYGTGQAGASASAGKTKVQSDFKSVTEQSAIRAQDGGFQVSVAGDATLTGGAITSSDKAVREGRNGFSTAGELTTTDVQNTALYKADASGITVGVGGQLGSSGAGLGSDKGSASSTTEAAISGLAGNKAARTGDANAGIAPIFDKDKVKADVNAQVVITTAFVQQAVPAAARFADGRAVALRREGDEAEARKWDEGGEYRTAVHAGIGLLTGGLAGAAGAAAGAALVPVLGEQIALMDLPEPVRQGLTQVVGAVVGAAAGGATGAATSLNQTAHNYATHSPYARVRLTVSQENARLTQACGASCSAEDFRRIDQQMAQLEAAGNLAEIARHSGLTPQQAQQLGQLALELVPVYGTGEALVQLITGHSSVSGEEVSRFWAAVGVVPVAGGVLRRAGVPAVEALSAIFKEAEASKAVSKSLVDIAHTIGADFNVRTGKVTGGHTLINGDVRVTQVVTAPDANGVYEAVVEIRAPDGSWQTKTVGNTNKPQKNTMFPSDWDVQRVQAEIDSAWASQRPHPQDKNKWIGTSSSGVEIEGYKQPRTTAYPLYREGRKP